MCPAARSAVCRDITSYSQRIVRREQAKLLNYRKGSNSTLTRVSNVVFPKSSRFRGHERLRNRSQPRRETSEFRDYCISSTTGTKRPVNAEFAPKSREPDGNSHHGLFAQYLIYHSVGGSRE